MPKKWQLNREGYYDMTAGLALRRMSREEYFAEMDAVKARMEKAFATVEEYLHGHGCHLEGAFQIVDDKTNIYKNLRRAQPCQPKR